MKKLFMICLTAGYSHCFAQNIGLKELLQVMEAPSIEWVGQYLSPMGYFAEYARIDGLLSKAKWSFKTDKTPDAPTVAELYQVTDPSGMKLVFTTSNPFFYTNIVNQVAIYNFQFKQATPENDRVNLLFNNPTYQLQLELVPNIQLEKLYTVTLRPINKSQTNTTQPGPKISQTWLRFDKMGVVNQ
jgi:hypothetical protein